MLETDRQNLTSLALWTGRPASVCPKRKRKRSLATKKRKSSSQMINFDTFITKFFSFLSHIRLKNKKYNSSTIMHPRNRHRSRTRSHLPHRRSKFEKGSLQPTRFSIFISVLIQNRFTFYLSLVDDFRDKEMVVFLLEIVEGFISGRLFLQFLDFHLVVVQLVVLGVPVLED